MAPIPVQVPSASSYTLASVGGSESTVSTNTRNTWSTDGSRIRIVGCILGLKTKTLDAPENWNSGSRWRCGWLVCVGRSWGCWMKLQAGPPTRHWCEMVVSEDNGVNVFKDYKGVEAYEERKAFEGWRGVAADLYFLRLKWLSNLFVPTFLWMAWHKGKPESWKSHSTQIIVYSNHYYIKLLVFQHTGLLFSHWNSHKHI